MARRPVPRIRRTALAALLVLFSGGATAHAANPEPPGVTTGGADSISSSGATLSGTVSAGGAETAVHFDYGTSAGYGLSTLPVTVGAEASAETVRIPVSSLTAGTTYHLRVVATNAAGTVYGDDRTFTTTGTPRPPSVQTRSVVDLNSGGATLIARVEPRGLPTTVIFDWGASSTYGNHTASQTVPAGNEPVFVRQPLGGLSANSTYVYRAVATNAAGTGRGNPHTFRTTRGITTISLKLAARHVAWSEQALLGGKVEGLSVNAVKVTLWQQDHPFTGPFRAVETVVASSRGTFGFTTKPIFWASRFRVTADTPAGVSSPTATTIGDLRTKLRVNATHRRTAQLRGYSYPATKGSATIQRRTPKGRWITVKRNVPLVVDQARNRSRVSSWVPRLGSRSARYRAVISPSDGGAHALTATRSTVVARQRS